MYLTDDQGTDYLDFFGGILTVSVGHCNDEVNRAIIDQNETLQHTSTLYLTAPQVKLAEKIAEITPGALQKSFFTSSGTEANETAVFLARHATGRSDIVALRHAYSGRSEVTLNITAHAPWRTMPSAIPYIKHAHNPYCYRCSLGLTYPSCELRCARDVEELIQTTTTGEIAAFMAEPIQGVGGFITPPKEYFQEVLAIVRKYGGLFICDEVQTGWGRTGTAWCGIEHWGVQPDIMTFAKGIANGIPMGATMATAAVADTFKRSLHRHLRRQPGQLSRRRWPPSTSSNRTACPTTPRYRAADCARDWRPCRRNIPASATCAAWASCRPWRSSIPASPDGKAPDPKKVLRIFEETRRLGLLIGKGGLYGNVIRLTPPLIVSAAEVDEALRLLERAFATAG